MSRPRDARPVLLLVGTGEPMEVALRISLDRRGVAVHNASVESMQESAASLTPALILMIGDAAMDPALVEDLTHDEQSAGIPVALLLDGASLGDRIAAFKSGAIAVVQKDASVDSVAGRIADLISELPRQRRESTRVLGEATLEELVGLVTSELKSGILSVDAGDDPIKVVLGSGGKIQDAVRQFVADVTPLIEDAQPVRYEFEESTGRELTLETAPPNAILDGLRILLMDDDSLRGDLLARALRARGSQVAVTPTKSRSLDHARALDPDIVVVSSGAMEADGFEAIRAFRRDPQLRWASTLIVREKELWPTDPTVPDIDMLGARIAPLMQADKELAEKIDENDSFDTRLELTGPARMLRAIARTPGTRHVVVRSPEATVEIDIADGLIVGARGSRFGDATDVSDGTSGLAILIGLATGRVHVEGRAHPSVANVMAPVDEALAAAARDFESAKVPATAKYSVPGPKRVPPALGALPKVATKKLGGGTLSLDPVPPRPPEEVRAEAPSTAYHVDQVAPTKVRLAVPRKNLPIRVKPTAKRAETTLRGGDMRRDVSLRADGTLRGDARQRAEAQDRADALLKADEERRAEEKKRADEELRAKQSRRKEPVLKPAPLSGEQLLTDDPDPTGPIPIAEFTAIRQQAERSEARARTADLSWDLPKSRRTSDPDEIKAKVPLVRQQRRSSPGELTSEDGHSITTAKSFVPALGSPSKDDHLLPVAARSDGLSAGLRRPARPRRTSPPFLPATPSDPELHDPFSAPKAEAADMKLSLDLGSLEKDRRQNGARPSETTSVGNAPFDPLTALEPPPVPRGLYELEPTRRESTESFPRAESPPTEHHVKETTDLKEARAKALAAREPFNVEEDTNELTLGELEETNDDSGDFADEIDSAFREFAEPEVNEGLDVSGLASAGEDSVTIATESILATVESVPSTDNLDNLLNPSAAAASDSLLGVGELSSILDSETPPRPEPKDGRPLSKFDPFSDLASELSMEPASKPLPTTHVFEKTRASEIAGIADKLTNTDRFATIARRAPNSQSMNAAVPPVVAGSFHPAPTPLAEETRVPWGVLAFVSLALLTLLGLGAWYVFSDGSTSSEPETPPSAQAPVPIPAAPLPGENTTPATAQVDPSAQPATPATAVEPAAPVEPTPAEPAAPEPAPEPAAPEPAPEPAAPEPAAPAQAETDLPDLNPRTADGEWILTREERRDPDTASDELVAEAKRMIRRNELDQAEQLLRRAMHLDRRNARGMAAHARLSLTRGDAETAQSWITRALRLRPRRAAYHTLRGDILDATGDREGARASWRRALSFNSRDRTARRRLAATDRD